MKTASFMSKSPRISGYRDDESITTRIETALKDYDFGDRSIVMMNPLQQGLKQQGMGLMQIDHINRDDESITTRIETQ